VTRDPGGTLGAIQTLSRAGQNAVYPRVGVGSGGDAVAAWIVTGPPTDPYDRVQAAAGP
jgi:hypothetical protein